MVFLKTDRRFDVCHSKGCNYRLPHAASITHMPYVVANIAADLLGSLLLCTYLESLEPKESSLCDQFFQKSPPIRCLRPVSTCCRNTFHRRALNIGRPCQVESCGNFGFQAEFEGESVCFTQFNAIRRGDLFPEVSNAPLSYGNCLHNRQNDHFRLDFPGGWSRSSECGTCRAVCRRITLHA